mmetsp:Transcript_18027/g.43669  ORF Transcript_18027/g.43669 Transcript_18027/m.43669 type:complete len:83 (-) Transcript_18027:237-485(-)
MRRRTGLNETVDQDQKGIVQGRDNQHGEAQSTFQCGCSIMSNDRKGIMKTTSLSTESRCDSRDQKYVCRRDDAERITIMMSD